MACFNSFLGGVFERGTTPGLNGNDWQASGCKRSGEGSCSHEFSPCSFFILAVLWSSAIHEDDLVACSIPIPESYGLTRCDFALGQSVLPWVNGIGLLSSAIVLVSTVRLLQKMPSGVIHT